jgi:hypothetical protein
VKTRSITPVILVIFTGAAILALLYGTSLGRRGRREALRVVRLAGNITQIYPRPVLTTKIWRGTRHPVLDVEVYESGRLMISGRENIKVQLPRDAVDGIVEIGKAALGDFGSGACGTVPGGVNAELYLTISGARMGSICHDAPDSPHGPQTARLLAEIQSHLPAGRRLHGEF